MLEIFEQGIAGRNATFETEAPSWEAWDRSQLDGHRWVAVEDGRVVGWVAAHPVSSRPCYRGVVEHSVYVDDEWQGRGIGRALLERLFESTEQDGIWTIQTGVFPENEASLAAARAVRLPGRRHPGAARKAGRRLEGRRRPRTAKRADHMTKVEAVVIRERVETVIDAVEAETGHVGVTVVEAIGHGRQRGVTHEYRGRVFESRFLPKALLTFIVEDSHRGRRSSLRSPTPRGRATSRATESCGRPRSRTRSTTEPDCALAEAEVA